MVGSSTSTWTAHEYGVSNGWIGGDPFSSIPFARTGRELEGLRGVERLVRVERVHAEEERALLLQVVEQVDPGSHHARRGVLALGWR